MSHTIMRQHDRIAVAMRVFGAVGLAFALLLNASFAARAGPLCLNHGDLTERLRDQYAERRVAIATTATGSLVEVFSSPDGATWTMVVTLVDGRSCVLIAGENWMETQQVAADGPGV